MAPPFPTTRSLFAESDSADTLCGACLPPSLRLVLPLSGSFQRRMCDLVEYVNSGPIVGERLSAVLSAICKLGINSQLITPELSTLAIVCYALGSSNEQIFIRQQSLSLESPVGQTIAQILFTLESHHLADIEYLLMSQSDFPQHVAERVRVILSDAEFMARSSRISPQLQSVEV